MPCSPGARPVVIDVSAAAVVDGTIVVIGPPAIEHSVGARERRSWSCSQPSPSSTSSTTWSASTAGAGSQAGASGHSRRAGTTFAMQAPS